MNRAVTTIQGDPSTTVSITTANNWQFLGALLAAAYPDIQWNADQHTMVVKGRLAPITGILSVATGGNAAQYGWHDEYSDPLGGHELAAAASVTVGGQHAIQDIQVRNKTAGSNSTIVVTIFF